MTHHPKREANDFDDLPEPARSQAVETFHQLIEDGRSEAEADKQARDLALNWLSERAPTAKDKNGEQKVG
jgi:hypothetical protein